MRVPENLTIEGTTYKITSFGGLSGHKGLELISLPESLSKISASSFSGCEKLFEITLPKDLQTIEFKAFLGCSKLKTVHIPAKVETIGDAAFGDCGSLTSITVDDNNANFEVANYCLVNKSNANNHKLLQGFSSSSTIPEGVKTLGQYCFAGKNIKTIDIPKEVTDIPSNAFSSSSLTQISFPSDSELASLTDACFMNCSKLAAIDLPSKLTTIGTFIFSGSGLENVTIPKSVNTIQTHAFGDMKKLKTVTFEKRVDAANNVVIPTTIDAAAFESSGSKDSPITFNLPWTKQQHVDTFKKGETYAFGATYANINFEYEEGKQ